MSSLKPSGSDKQPLSGEDQTDGISAMTISQYGGIMGALDKSVGNVSALSGMYTKRSPYLNRFKNMENEESLSLTPNSHPSKTSILEGPELGSQDLKSSTSDFKQNNLKHQQL